jgi:hypothetical protein
MYLVQTARNCDPYLANSGTLQELIDQSSGSGSGLPLLVSTADYTYMILIMRSCIYKHRTVIFWIVVQFTFG